LARSLDKLFNSSNPHTLEGNFMATSTLHEPSEHLTAQTIDIHRAIISLIEELEAVDWYNQRAEAAKDPQLQSVIEHNRGTKRHACMTLEWIRATCQVR
jgi:uncharacterized protein